MMRRSIRVCLCLAIIVGGFLAWQTGRTRGRLQAEFRRLARITGDFTVDDPTKLNIMAIETGEPLHFAWRVYRPPNYQQIVRQQSGQSTSTSSGSGSHEFLARVRFREDDQGHIEVYTTFGGGSSRQRLGDASLAKLLHGRWDKLITSQLGSEGRVMVAPDESAAILRLTLPEDMKAEAEQTLSPWLMKQYVPVVYQLDLGPLPTKPKSLR